MEALLFPGLRRPEKEVNPLEECGVENMNISLILLIRYKATETRCRYKLSTEISSIYAIRGMYARVTHELC